MATDDDDDHHHHHDDDDASEDLHPRTTVFDDSCAFSRLLPYVWNEINSVMS